VLPKLLAEWGQEAGKTSTLRREVIERILNMDATAWQEQLSPGEHDAWRNQVNEARNELDGSLSKKEDAKYYVDPNQGGTSAEARASALQEAVNGKLKIMVG